MKARGSKRGLINNLIVKFIPWMLYVVPQKVALTRAMPFPRYLYIHDWWLGLVAELGGNVIFCEDKFLLYRRHSTNASPTLMHKHTFFRQLINRLGFIRALLLLKGSELIKSKT